MGYKAYSDGYLMSLTKAQIIELLRIAEHNFFVTEEALNNSANAGMEIAEKYGKAKRLLKAAVEDIQDMLYQVDSVTVCTHCIHTSTICYGGSDCEHEAKWTHLDEALKLIGEDTNVPASADDTNVGGKIDSWISCKDRLPEPDTMVIVASYGSDIVIPEDSETVEECCERLKKERVRVTLGFIGLDGWYGSDYFPLIVTPSFWQPLPEPPKGGDTE